MTGFINNHGHRVLDCLNLQVSDRCRELAIMLERCSLRELQSLFPIIMESIFGPCDGQQKGWGLRTTIRENDNVYNFDMLLNFFAPNGPMINSCYRLVQDSYKFEISLANLPRHISDMLQSGKYDPYYTDLLLTDTFARSVVSLSLNAFDYFMVHFIIHALAPLHTIDPLAQHVHTDCKKTVYFILVRDYLATYLPSTVDNVLSLPDLCLTVKTSQPVTMPTYQPQRSPKYLRIPNNNLFNENRTQLSPTSNAANQSLRHAGFSTDLVRNNTWRTESVLHLFLDFWLRSDIESTRHLPGSEFVRVVRLLVKQVHAFALAAPMDETTMFNLRQIAHPLLRALIYNFLRSMIARWPLDSSMAMVLELWYSYLQPWRYVRYNEYNSRQIPTQLPRDSRYENFIADNIYIYTQIFLQVMPRFQRLDFTINSNCQMLNRLTKVFSMSIPPHALQEAEERYLISSYGLDGSTKRHSSLSDSHQDSSFYYGKERYLCNDHYVPMFDVNTQMQVEYFASNLKGALRRVETEVEGLRKKKLLNERSYGIFKYVARFLQKDINEIEIALHKMEDTMQLLDASIHSLCNIFNVQLPTANATETQLFDSFEDEFSDNESSKEPALDITNINSVKMKRHLQHILATPAVDPAILPIQMHECKLLVRFLHQVSCQVNEMLGDKIAEFYQRDDFVGKLSRQILLPPMITAHFEKTTGVSELHEERLPARLCLRSLASYQTLFFIFLSLMLGQILWTAPSFGLFMFLMIMLFYNIIMALLSK